MARGVGLIGLGIMGRRMLRGVSNHSGFEPKRAWDPAPEAFGRAREEAAGLASADSAVDLISSSDVEVVYIASPPSTHLEYVTMAAEAGKGVFCEKPLAVDLEAGRRTVEAVRSRGVPNAVNFPFGSAPSVLTMERIIRERRLGTPKLCEIGMHFSDWPRNWQKAAAGWLGKRAEGGFLREVFSHFAYLTRRLLGDLGVRNVRVDFPEDGETAERYVQADLEGGGVRVKLSGGVGGAAPDSNEWTLYGSEASLRMRDWRRLEFTDGTEWKQLPPDREALPHLGDQLNALERVLAGETGALPDLNEGLQVQQVVEGLLKQGAAEIQSRS